MNFRNGSTLFPLWTSKHPQFWRHQVSSFVLWGYVMIPSLGFQLFHWSSHISFSSVNISPSPSCIFSVLDANAIFSSQCNIFIPPYASNGGYLVYCEFVILSFCMYGYGFLCGGKKIAAWHFACVFDYYPGWASLILGNFGSRESRRRHYFRDELYRTRSGAVGIARHGLVGIRNRRRHGLRPYGGICVLQACWRTCLFMF